MRLKGKRVHLVGIGGAGMSGIAHILLKKGYQVSGSDLINSPIIQRLESERARVFIGHHESNLKDANWLVYSSAVSLDNPEIVGAIKRGIPILKRAQMLAELMKDEIGIAVAGAHGKTTTASLVSLILIQAGLKPTVAIGGVVRNLKGGVCLGDGRYFVAEADESDGSFLCYSPTYSIITNIDREHLDYYSDLGQIKDTFVEFVNRNRQGGCIFYSGEDRNVIDILNRVNPRRRLSFGFSPDCNIYPKNILLDGFKSEFDCFYREERLGRVTLPLSGGHNILNSLAALGLGMEMGIGFSEIQKVFLSFRGIERRFELKANVRGIMVVDDYAHHPTEIMATLRTAKIFNKRRIIVIFQPHRFSRTRYLKDEFGKSFFLADYLIVTDIYPASERPLEGVTGRDIYNRAKEEGHGCALFLPREEILEHLLRVLRAGDLVITMGAGDIGKLANELVQELKRKGLF